jgi:hypothetical protein
VNADRPTGWRSGPARDHYLTKRYPFPSTHYISCPLCSQYHTIPPSAPHLDVHPHQSNHLHSVSPCVPRRHSCASPTRPRNLKKSHTAGPTSPRAESARMHSTLLVKTSLADLYRRIDGTASLPVMGMGTWRQLHPHKSQSSTRPEVFGSGIFSQTLHRLKIRSVIYQRICIANQRQLVIIGLWDLGKAWDRLCLDIQPLFTRT